VSGFVICCSLENRCYPQRIFQRCNKLCEPLRIIVARPRSHAGKQRIEIAVIPETILDRQLHIRAGTEITAELRQDGVELSARIRGKPQPPPKMASMSRPCCVEPPEVKSSLKIFGNFMQHTQHEMA
jgi:hypothetical protein